jgi:hypothetical protein
MSDEKYRVETGAVYEYCEEQRAYVFIGNLNGDTLIEFLEDYWSAEG